MRLLVIDGNSIVNRAFYGIKLLTTKDGQFTNGIFGFMNILLRLREECEPDHVAIAFDLHAPTFRHKLFDGYKAGRKGMPPELRSQMPLLKELLCDLGYAIVEQEGFEADDILGTLSAQCKGSEIKALMGDSSDNIPGVAGIGQKTAGALIQQYETIDYIYDHLDELDVKAGVREKLRAGKDSAFLSRTLGTIVLDAPIEKDLSAYAPTKGDPGAAIRLLAKLEMFSTIEKLGLTAIPQPAAAEEAAPQPAVTLREERDLMGLLGKLKNAGEAYFTALFEGESLAAFCFSMQENGGETILYVPADCFDFDTFSEAFFKGPWKKYTCDAKDLYRYCLRKGWTMQHLALDTTLAGYILNPSANAYDLLRLAGELAVPVPALDCNDTLQPAAQGAAVLRRVSALQLEQIHENEQDFLLREIELPLCEVLAEMEHTGFAADRTEIEAYGRELGAKIDELTTKIFDEAGFHFNLNSPKQLGEALFEKLGLPAKKKTKSGWSTSAEVLETLAYDYPIVADILRYRTLSKLKSTYCDGLLKEIEPDGRIRSRLNQTETRTGRISSLEPNLQNIPVRYPEGREIRRFFTAGAGMTLVDADYSQIELRVLAAIADDENMKQAFNNGDDIHAITASQVFNLPLSMVTPLLRSRAKAVNFGIVYGIGAFSLAKDIGVTRKEADAYIKGYLSHYSGIDRYMHDVVETARDKGYAETIFHRRRYLPELTASNKMLQAFGERVARNMPVQGTAADIIKIAMVHVRKRLKDELPAARLIMQVHDELIVECPASQADNAADLLRREMEQAVSLSVKLLCDVHCGKTWYEAKE